jgi:L-malate glycosyltransferase
MQRIEETYGGIESFTCSLFKWLNKQGVTTLMASRRLSLFNPVKISDEYFKTEKPLKITGWQFPLPIYAIGLIVCSLYSSIALIKCFSKKGIDLIHVQDPSFSGIAGIIVSKWFKVPLIVHSHGPPIYLMDKSFRSPVWAAIDTALTKITVNNADAIIVTDMKTEQFISAFTKKSEKIIRIPTAIDFESFQTLNLNNNKSFAQKELIFGFIGRLNYQKNPSVIIDAVENLNTNRLVKVLIAGDGPLRPYIENRLKTSKIKDCVTLLGAVTEEEKDETLEKIDIFIMPSIVEGCPIALLEAMAASKAIIASNIPSIREVVRNGHEAILIDPRDSEKIRDALEILCDNQVLRDSLGSNANDRAQSFDIHLIYSQILRLYMTQIRLKYKL